MALKKVSNQINHINKRNSVLIVTGKQAAKIYELRRGRIVQDPAINIENPKYSDKEGFNMRRGKGSVWGTASDYESKDDGVIIDFLHEFQKETKELMLRREFDEVYLFAPSECFRRIKDSLPKDWQAKLTFEYHGNFTKFSPSKLLEKITERREQQINNKKIELKGEPRKLLRRGKIRQSKG